ncbi:MAG: hypothetical protein WKF32_00715 [Thermoleophilaceae bacterium]
MHPFEDAAATAVERRDGGRVMGLDDGDEVSDRELLVATERAPRVYGIDLKSVGIDPDTAGPEVDQRCRAVEGVDPVCGLLRPRGRHRRLTEQQAREQRIEVAKALLVGMVFFLSTSALRSP